MTRVGFGEFVLDTETLQLLRRGQAVHLSPKAYQLLAILVEDRPKALSKTDLQRRLWPETFVVETNLANLVGEIREALGDDSRRPRHVRTVHGFGYAFQGAQAGSRAAPGNVYRLIWKGGRATRGSSSREARRPSRTWEARTAPSSRTAGSGRPCRCRTATSSTSARSL